MILQPLKVKRNLLKKVVDGEMKEQSAALSRAEIRSIGVVLQHQEIEFIQQGQQNKLFRVWRLRYAFAIPQWIEHFKVRSQNVLVQKDILWLIRVIERYLFSQSPRRIVNQSILKGVLPKLLDINLPKNSMRLTFPDLKTMWFDEQDIHYVGQGLLVSEIELNDLINDLDENNELFRRPLEDELECVKRWQGLIHTYRLMALDVLVENTLPNLKDAIYLMTVLLKGIGMYEEQQLRKNHVEVMEGMRPTYEKLLYMRGSLMEHRYKVSENDEKETTPCVN